MTSLFRSDSLRPVRDAALFETVSGDKIRPFNAADIRCFDSIVCLLPVLLASIATLVVSGILIPDRAILLPPHHTILYPPGVSHI